MCGSGDMLVDRKTHRHTCSLQYFASAAAGEVIMDYLLLNKI